MNGKKWVWLHMPTITVIDTGEAVRSFSHSREAIATLLRVCLNRKEGREGGRRRGEREE